MSKRPDGSRRPVTGPAGSGRDAWHGLAGRVPDLRSLCYLLAVTEERHFGRAARRLHMVPDPVASVAGGIGAVLATSAFVETPGVGRVVAPRALDPPLSVPDTAVAWLADPCAAG